MTNLKNSDIVESPERAGYIMRQWSGLNSLEESFWTNFILLTVIATFVLGVVRLGVELTANMWGDEIAFVFFFLLVTWQGVGLLRTCMRIVKSGGGYVWPAVTMTAFIALIATGMFYKAINFAVGTILFFGIFIIGGIFIP